VSSRTIFPGLWRQRSLKISVQRDARLVVPASAIIEGLVDRLALVGGIGWRLAAWRVRPEAQVLQYPPDSLGLAAKLVDVHLSAALGTDRRIDFPDLLDQLRQDGDGISRELSIPISISSTTCLDELIIFSAAGHACHAAGWNSTTSSTK